MNRNGSYEEELEAAELEFLEALDQGQQPTLEDYVRRYPHLKKDLADFICHATAHRARLEVIDQAGRDPEAEAIVERVLQERPIQGESFTARLNELDISATKVAARANVPVEVIVAIQRQILAPLPDRLLTKLGRILLMPVGLLAQLTEAVAPRPRVANAFRAEGEPAPIVDTIKSFDDLMRELRDNGKLSDEQIEEWVG